MAKSNRQKYNFLVALTSQLEEAIEDGTEEAAEFRRVLADIGVASDVDTDDGSEEREAIITDRIAKLEQWNAQLESALEMLESSIGASDDEDTDGDDGGVDDDDLARDEPRMDSRHRRNAGDAAVQGGTGRPPLTMEPAPRRRVVSKNNA